MQSTIYLLLITLGALLILGIFHFTIYLQQNDKAFRNYSFYLLVMAAFNIVRLLDARLTSYYPLSYYTVETLDPLLSNIAFLMYVNFLGVILNITPLEKFYYKCWKGLQLFITSFLLLYLLLRLAGDQYKWANTVITVASFTCMGFGLVMTFRLLGLRKEIFYQLIIAGTIVSVLGVFAGLIMNVFVYKENLAFGGLFFLEPSMMVEAVFLSAALGYRLKIAYHEKEIFQKSLLEETQKREVLALQTAQLLRQELDIRQMQSRISKDLHDDVGSSLSGLQIYSSLAATLMDKKPEEAKKMLQQIAANTAEVMQNMEHIVWAMQPSEKNCHTMEAKLKDIGYGLLTIKNIQCIYSICPSVEAVCKGMELRKNIVLIAKEAINNIAKYSNASNVVVSLYDENNHIFLSINDDGNGFDMENYKAGNGLLNMQTRANTLGGATNIQSVMGKGTSIICIIPVTNISDTMAV